ncbi:MAG: hypothetical protein V3U80_09375 [Flavobacteriaceae bacterium]
MKSLFFVSSPLEMICAIEARKQFKTKDTILVLYLFDVDKKIIEYIMSLDEKWPTIYKPFRSSINYGKKWVKLTNQLKKEKYHYFFSSGMTFSANLIYNINYKELYFLDDGTLTLTNVAYFNEHGNLTKKLSLFPGHNKFKFKHKVNEAIHYLFGHKLRGKWNSLSLFTFFDIPKSNNIHIARNELTWFHQLKEKKVLKPTDDLVFIIGTPLVEVKIISKAYYHKLLQKIVTHFSSKKIVYVPHRWEDKNNVSHLKSLFNFEVRFNKNIIEMDFLIESILPKHIAGTISTALFTLKKLYPKATIYNAAVDLDEVNPLNKEAVKAIKEHQKDLFKILN